MLIISGASESLNASCPSGACNKQSFEQPRHLGGSGDSPIRAITGCYRRYEDLLQQILGFCNRAADSLGCERHQKGCSAAEGRLEIDRRYGDLGPRVLPA